MPSKLLAFSDDMDGLRKVPDNIPNRAMLTPFLGKPLTQIPDPFGTHDSFGAHNNARLRAFLDSFGFEYEFASSTEYYKAGRFDAALIAHPGVLRRRHGGDPADAGAGPAGDLFADPADPSADRHRHAGADEGDRPRGRHSHVGRPGHRRDDRDLGQGRRTASCNGRPTGRCAGTRWASITRCPART